MASPDLFNRRLSRRDILKGTPKAAVAIAVGFSALGCAGKAKPRSTDTQTVPVVDVTPTLEPVTVGEALIEVGDFQVFPLKWAERVSEQGSKPVVPTLPTPSGQYTYYPEKFVSIWTAIRNNSDKLTRVTSKSLWDLPIVVNTNQGERETRKYPLLTGEDLLVNGEELAYYFYYDEWYGFNGAVLPPGFALPVGITASIPTEAGENYQLLSKDISAGKKTRVERGAITKDFKLVPEIIYKKINEPLVVPGFGSLAFAGETIEKPYDTEYQNINFSFENLGQSELVVPFDTKVSVIVYFKDGNVSVGRYPLNNIGILPGDKKIFNLQLGQRSHLPNGFQQDTTASFDGAIVVASMKDQWIAWKPE